jgi:hypothetical protein
MDRAGARKVLDTLARIDTVLNLFDFEDETQDPVVSS